MMNKSENEELLKLIGERLRSIRKKKGYSNHEDLANDLEMTRSQYWEYENGKNITISTLKRILNKLDISLRDFFSEDID